MFKHDSEFMWRPGRIYVPVTAFTGLKQLAFTPAGTSGTSSVTGNVTVVGGGVGEAIGINPDSNAGVLSKAAATNRTIPIATFLGAAPTAGAQTFTGTEVAVDTLIGSAGVGTALLKEVSTFGVMGLLMNTAADEVNHQMLLPGDLDITKPIRVRLHWTSGSSDTADTVTWKVRYLKIVPDTTAIVSAATALDVVVAEDNALGTAYIHQTSSWGAILPAVTAFADNVEVIQWEVEMDAKAAGLTEDLFLMGLELEYTPHRLAYSPMRYEAKRPSPLFSQKYAN